MPNRHATRRGISWQPFKLAAVRYAAACGKSQRAAALDMGLSDKTLGEWVRDGRPDAAGVVDAPRFDQLAQLRLQNRELLARNTRLTAERDFLKKCASYFATPPNGSSALPPPIPIILIRYSRIEWTATLPPPARIRSGPRTSPILHTDEGFVYLAGVVDLFSRRIVGWAMKDTLHADLCIEGLAMALVHRQPKHSILHHSDRGCQYAGKQYQDKLIEFTLECSMSRVGNCWDNAWVESLWASLKNELVFQRKLATKQQAKDAIFQWIEVWYNRKRRHSSLGYLSPEAFKAKQN